MSQSEVWILYIKLMYIMSGNHRKCWIYVVHLAQHSAPDSKTQHRAFIGISHQVLMNNSEKLCWFLLANPWQQPVWCQGQFLTSYSRASCWKHPRSLHVPLGTSSHHSPPLYNYFFHGAEKSWHLPRSPSLWLNCSQPRVWNFWSCSATYWTFLFIKAFGAALHLFSWFPGLVWNGEKHKIYQCSLRNTGKQIQ